MPSQSPEREPLLSKGGPSSTRDAEPGTPQVKANQGEVEGYRLTLAVLLPLFGLLLCALDVTMVSTVSATIAAEFDSLAVVSWLGSAYLVAVAAIQPISGKITDTIGRRTGYFCALACFTVGNLMCGFAPNQATIIAGRVIAGVGGGAISSIGNFITGDLVPLRKRPVWQGLGNVFWASGMGIGGVFGGFISDTIGWRWTFLSLVPCTASVAIGCYFFLVPGLPRRKPDDTMGSKKAFQGFDFLGSILLTGTLTCFVLGLNFQEQGKNKILSLVLVIVSAVLLVFFLIAESFYVAQPVIPIHLLGKRSVAGTCFAGLLISISMHSLLFYVPLLIQARGFSAGETGLQLLGGPLGGAITPISIGLALRKIGGYTVIKPLAYCIYIVGPIGFYFSTLESPAWTTVVLMVFLSSGFGSVLNVNLVALLANIDDRLQATATGMLYAFRQGGASAGLAIAGIIFRSRFEKELMGSISNLSDHLAIRGLPGSISHQCNRHDYVGSEAPRVCQLYYIALHDVFIFTLATGVAGFVCALFIKNKSLDRGKAKQVDEE